MLSPERRKGAGVITSFCFAVFNKGSRLKKMSSTISRVLYRMIIYLDCTLPYSSFAPCGTKRDIPESTTGRRIAFCFVLLRVGFTQPPTLPQERWSLTPPFHPYRQKPAVSFLLHWPSGHPDRTLSGTLPCGARTFLTSCGRDHLCYSALS